MLVKLLNLLTQICGQTMFKQKMIAKALINIAGIRNTEEGVLEFL